MKKVLTTILCAIPLVANAVVLGGFDFPEALVTKLSEDDYLVAKYVKSDYWIGFYKKSKHQFHLFKKATVVGDNFVWEIDSFDKEKILKKTQFGTVRSLVSLSEVDCVNYRIRTVSEIPFIGYFGEGDNILEFQGTIQSEWRYLGKEHTILSAKCELLSKH